MRQNLRDFLNRPYEYFLILSGDQLYRMDFRDLLQQHIGPGRTSPWPPCPSAREAASGFGIMHTDAERRIIRFEEKPKDPALLDELRIPADLLKELGQPAEAELYQASMGIYVFNRQVLIEALDNKLRRFRQAHHPGRAHQAPGRFLHLPGLLGGHRHDPRLLRGQPRSHRRGAAVQFLRHEPPRFTPTRVFCPASKINGASIDAGNHLRRLHHRRRAHRPGGHRRAQLIESGTTIRNSRPDGGRFLRGEARRTSAGPSAARHRAELRDRPRDHRQERAHRRRGGDHAGG